MDTALVIMAAGIGSRFGNGIKQLQKIGPNGEIIMDYSIHDAIEAGFNKVIFVIRKEIEHDFKECIGDRTEQICKRLNVRVEYVFQSLDQVPDGAVVPEGRTKPWGTGQAVLSAKSCIHEPFAVINADDYYGKQAFQSVHDYLVEHSSHTQGQLCMTGYHLKNTLSEFGSVTRGVCHVDAESNLISIREMRGVRRENQSILYDQGFLDGNAVVSMNMFGMGKEFLNLLEDGFRAFFQKSFEDDLKKEFLIPEFIGDLLKDGKISVKVLESRDRWLGITYQEDTEGVQRSIQELYAQGMYQNELYRDLL